MSVGLLLPALPRRKSFLPPPQFMSPFFALPNFAFPQQIRPNIFTLNLFAMARHFIHSFKNRQHICQVAIGYAKCEGRVCFVLGSGQKRRTQRGGGIIGTLTKGWRRIRAVSLVSSQRRKGSAFPPLRQCTVISDGGGLSVRLPHVHHHSHHPLSLPLPLPCSISSSPPLLLSNLRSRRLFVSFFFNFMRFCPSVCLSNAFVSLIILII